ncbi:hypothetical protein Trydic_g7127 [Trypoxylus dichotomus]
MAEFDLQSCQPIFNRLPIEIRLQLIIKTGANVKENKRCRNIPLLKKRKKEGVLKLPTGLNVKDVSGFARSLKIVLSESIRMAQAILSGGESVCGCTAMLERLERLFLMSRGARYRL